MDVNGIQEYLNEEHPDLRLNIYSRSDKGPLVVEIIGRVEYGFFLAHNTSANLIDCDIDNVQSLVGFAQDVLDRMKIYRGTKLEVLGVQAVLVEGVEGDEYWVSETDYVKLLNQVSESSLMVFDGKPIKYHETLA